MNIIHLIGNTGKDVEIYNFDENNKVGNFTLATKEIFKNADGEKITKTTWFNCQVRNQLADLFYTYVKKGHQIAVTGKMTFREYEKDGIKFNTHTVEVQSFDFLNNQKTD